GPQTAFVTGNNDQEIWTDQYGRVKVRFHWDRSGVSDGDSSCWVRVAQSFAGKRWGALFLPRVGQEVVVEFLDGDP
ncbi:phage baseplate assembly protein V, partial [Escherichia coli]|nr:phage baseplate assembly protein V [Escherichia coli]